MTTPHIFSRQSKSRRWLWLLVVLLPCALFAAAKEQQSWKPRTIHIQKSKNESLFMSWLQDGRLALVNENKILIVNTSTGKVERTILSSHKGSSVHSATYPLVEVSRDGKTLFAGYDAPSQSKKTGVVKIFDLSSGKLLRSLEGNPNFDVDEEWLYTLAHDSSAPAYSTNLRTEARVYNWQTGQLLSKVGLKIPLSYYENNEEFASGSLYKAGWSQDHSFLVTTFFGVHWEEGAERPGESEIGTGVFDLNTGKFTQLLSQRGVIFSHHKSFFAQELDEASGKRLEVWNLDTLKKISDVRCSPEGYLLDLSPDGKFATRADSVKKELQIVNSQTGQISRRISPKNYSPYFSPDGRTLAGWNEKDTITLLRVK